MILILRSEQPRCVIQVAGRGFRVRFALCGPLAWAVVLLLPGGARSADAFSLRHRFEVRYSIGSALMDGPAFAADVNGDGSAEVILTHAGRALCDGFLQGEQRVLWDMTLSPPGRLDAVKDVTGDGRPDLLVVSGEDGANGEAWLTCYGEYRARGAPGVSYRVGPFLRGCAVSSKVQNAGAVRVLGSFATGVEGRPVFYVSSSPHVPGKDARFVAAYDGRTGTLLWKYPIGPQPNGLALLPGRGGEEDRLILSTYAPNNGFLGGGGSDSLCSLIALSPRGDEQWCATLGGVFCGGSVAVTPAGADSSRRLLAGVARSGADSAAAPRGDLLLLDPSTGRVLQGAEPLLSIYSLLSTDLEGDGEWEILAWGRDQRLYCFDHRLTRRWRSDPPCSVVLGIEDYDGDGGRELATICAGGPFVRVLHLHGGALAEWELSGPILDASSVRIAGAPLLVVRTRDEVQILALRSPTVAPIVLQASGAVLTVALGLLLMDRRRRRLAERVVEQGEIQERLLDAMTAFGHAGSSLKVVDRLRFFLKNWERRAGRTEPGSDPLPGLIDDYEHSVLPDLVRLVSLARRARVRPEHWRHLAALGLTAAADLQRITESLWGGTPARIHRTERALESIEGSLQGIRRHLRQVFHAPVEEIARRVLDRRREDLAAGAVEARCSLTTPVPPAVFASPTVLEGVLDNLVDNALRALAGRARREIEIAVVEEGAHCHIDVRDTGCGIPAEDWERIFDRHYTTKDEGGFGLYYARETLARYEGRIFVLTSDPAQGTTFRLVLRQS